MDTKARQDCDMRPARYREDDVCKDARPTVLGCRRAQHHEHRTDTGQAWSMDSSTERRLCSHRGITTERIAHSVCHQWHGEAHDADVGEQAMQGSLRMILYTRPVYGGGGGCVWGRKPHD